MCSACYFGNREALKLLLTNERTRAIVDLNAPSLRCRRSGFLPVHAAVAGGRVSMYEFLVTLPGVPDRQQRLCNPSIKTRPQEAGALCLTALQLAFWHGDARTVQFVIEQRSRFQWR